MNIYQKIIIDMKGNEFIELKEDLNNVQYVMLQLVENISQFGKPDKVGNGYKELSVFLHVSESKAFKMIASGIIPVHPVEKTIFFVESEVIAALIKIPKRKKRGF